MKFKCFSREILKLRQLGVGALPKKVFESLERSSEIKVDIRQLYTLALSLCLAPLTGIGEIPLLTADVKSVKKQEKMELTSNLQSIGFPVDYLRRHSSYTGKRFKYSNTAKNSGHRAR